MGFVEVVALASLALAAAQAGLAAAPYIKKEAPLHFDNGAERVCG
jgi:hypothetical protein